ncbi:MAG: AAA family ATPase [Actinomycetota bacterium]
MPSCTGCGEDNPKKARFCWNCGASLTGAESPEQVRKTVSVVFNDVVDSTPLGEKLDPELLREVMVRFYDEMSRVAGRHGGSVIQFAGDAVLAVFGIPSVHEDDALRAVRAAVEMQTALAELNSELHSRWGVKLQSRAAVNTGQVLAAVETDRHDILVADAVNVAARLQQLARPGSILIGKPTLELIRDWASTTPLPPQILKGRSSPVEAFELVELFGERKVGASDATPLLGRDRELELLTNFFELGRARACLLFTIMGPAGIGKSRLVREFVPRLPSGIAVVGGRCLPYGDGITFWPIVEIVREAAGIENDDTPEIAIDKIADVLRDDEDPSIAEQMAQVIGVAARESSREQLFWAVRRFFEALGRHRPTVVSIDDLHWAEDTLLDLLEHIVDWAKDTQLFFLCQARPELLEQRPNWGGGKLNALSLTLEGLDDQGAKELLRHLLGAASANSELSERIAEAAEGNPLFIQETVSVLLERGSLRHTEGGLTPQGDVADIAVPASIQALLAARLEHLEPQERALLETASIMGRVFSVQAVDDLAKNTHPVDSIFERLWRKQMVEPVDEVFAGKAMYRFRHQLIRDVTYERMAKAARAHLHERYGNWLMAIVGDQGGSYDEIVAFHLERAYKYYEELGQLGDADPQLARRASDWLKQASDRAAERGDKAAALKLLRRALALKSDEDVSRVRLLPYLAGLLNDEGELESANRAYRSAIAAAIETGDRATEMHARMGMVLLQAQWGEREFADTLPDIAEAIAVLEEAGDDERLATALQIDAFVKHALGDLDSAEIAYRKARDLSLEAGHLHNEAISRRGLLGVMWTGQTKASALIRAAEDDLKWSRERGERLMESRALEAIAIGQAMLGNGDARETIEQSLDILRDLGSKTLTAWSALGASVVLMLDQDFAAAQETLGTATHLLEQSGETGTLSTLSCIRARVLLTLGDIAGAATAASRAAQLSSADDVLTQMLLAGVETRLAATHGRDTDVKQLAERAQGLAAETGFVYWHADVLVDVAEAFALVGASDRAASFAKRAIALYESKENRVSAAATKERLSGSEPIAAHKESS